MRIVLRNIVPHGGFRFIRIAVAAEIRAGIVPAHVAAFNAQTASAQSVVLYVAEGALVGFPEYVQRHAARRRDSVLGKRIPRGTGLNGNAVLRGDRGKSLCKLVFLRLGERNQFGHIVLQFCIHLDEAEYAARNVGRKLPAQHFKRFQMPSDGIGGREKNGVVPPCKFLPPDEAREGFEGLNARRKIGNVRLDVLSVRRDRVMEVGAVMVGNGAELIQHGRIVFGAE